MTFKYFGSLLLFCLATISLYSQTSPFALRGTILTPEGPIQDGTIVIENGKIAAVGKSVHIPSGMEIIETKGIIAPGLIDLHNHLTWNVFPRWKPNELFANRYAWQQRPTYRVLMTAPHNALFAEGYGCKMEIYAEVKAITEGETSVVGDIPCQLHLTRTLDNDSRLAVAPTQKVLYNVFPLEMNEAQLSATKQTLEATPHGYLLVHLSEGAPNDTLSAHEFTELKVRGLLKPGVSLIHAVALKAPDFAELAAAGVGFIWSPRSNIELYGATADVTAAKAVHVTIALAPDWSPTGSVGLLSELNYAATWNETQLTPDRKPLFNNRELLDMTTSHAAALVGLEKQVGSIAPGYAADLIVVQPAKEAPDGDPYWSVTHARPEDLNLVIINGQRVYGRSQFLRDPASEAVKICGTEKRVVSPLSLEPQTSFASIENELDAAMRRWGRTLAPLAECGE